MWGRSHAGDNTRACLKCAQVARAKIRKAFCFFGLTILVGRVALRLVLVFVVFLFRLLSVGLVWCVLCHGPSNTVIKGRLVG